MTTPSASQQAAVNHEYLAFTLGNEEYGIDILKVKEIRGYDAVTRIANTPEFIKGVINLRGVIVPIIDLRIKFQLGSVEYNEFTVVIIINVLGRVIGIVVDGVSDVVALTDEQIKPAPEFDSRIDTSHIVGLGSHNDQMLILMDIEKLVSSSDMQLVESADNTPMDMAA